ncbi:hypothetical protein L596_001864 [Steinernema carpocapsae]|uniref:Uncharacterized protein n=1 Tax=Steinernema carpocapsae TaxID=34508 RepID=A0A4U8UN00_STECR|nr:hypothetical protein L596_001864 [Steinernema carpocapsae]
MNRNANVCEYSQQAVLIKFPQITTFGGPPLPACRRDLSAIVRNGGRQRNTYFKPPQINIIYLFLSSCTRMLMSSSVFSTFNVISCFS